MGTTKERLVEKAEGVAQQAFQKVETKAGALVGRTGGSSGVTIYRARFAA